MNKTIQFLRLINCLAREVCPILRSFSCDDMIRVCLISASLLLAPLRAAAAPPQSVGPVPPFTPRQFAIMQWGRSPSDRAQMQLIKDVGLNVSGFCLARDVELVASAGLSCFLTDNRTHLKDWVNLPLDEKLRADLGDMKRQIGSNPAALGYLLQDEPSVSMMSGLGHGVNLMRAAMPDKWPLINLLPTYASPRQLGVGSYREYVQAAINKIRPPFLLFDNYALVDGRVKDFLFTNLEIMREFSVSDNIPFWACILSATFANYMAPSDATFNVQAYSTMAYGGRGIVYFTYFSPEGSISRLTAIDRSGKKTPTWDMMQRINSQINALAPTLIQLHSTGVFHSPDVPEQCQSLSESPMVASVNMTSTDQQGIVPHFLIGEFKDMNAHPYLMIVNKDLGHSFKFQIHLRNSSRRLLWISSVTGQEQPYKSEADVLAPGVGMLFRVQ